jgi:hypothetical protein
MVSLYFIKIAKKNGGEFNKLPAMSVLAATLE